jgi:lipoprotein-anchoring transpeptidase ErfK/SrfK
VIFLPRVRTILLFAIPLVLAAVAFTALNSSATADPVSQAVAVQQTRSAALPGEAVPAAVAKVKAPKPATKTRKARNVPERPMDGNQGRRIVYDKALMTVWVMDASDEVVARYPVVGRWDRPVQGKYRIYSKSPKSWNTESKVSFNHMVRFAWGPASKLSIGFHSIPRYMGTGKQMHDPDQLGLPIARGGCVRLDDADAKALYKWSKVGDRVIVLASP